MPTLSIPSVMPVIVLYGSPGMDVLAVREATRFAIDYCSVHKKVGLCAVQYSTVQCSAVPLQLATLVDGLKCFKWTSLNCLGTRSQAHWLEFF